MIRKYFFFDIACFQFFYFFVISERFAIVLVRVERVISTFSSFVIESAESFWVPLFLLASFCAVFWFLHTLWWCFIIQALHFSFYSTLLCSLMWKISSFMTTGWAQKVDFSSFLSIPIYYGNITILLHINWSQVWLSSWLQ